MGEGPCFYSWRTGWPDGEEVITAANPAASAHRVHYPPGVIGYILSGPGQVWRVYENHGPSGFLSARPHGAFRLRLMLE